jgi:hypothetical protein
MAKKKTLGAPKREVVWLSRASHQSIDNCSEEATFPDDADCPSIYSYPLTRNFPIAEAKPIHMRGHRRALVLNLLGFRLVLTRNSTPYAA